MVLRIRKMVFVGSLALVVAAVLALAGPLAGTASASPCKRFGNTMPNHLSHRHARMAVRCFLNRKREHHGLNNLRTNSRLKRAAQKHTDYMQRDKCFEYECPGERTVVGRIDTVQYVDRGTNRRSSLRIL